jgi:hypothetical protein
MAAVLGFDDRRIVDGSYAVVTPAGDTVASVSPSFWRSRFTASDDSGRLLCSGKARVISGWIAHDPDGAVLALVRVRPFDHHRTTLRGGELECRSIGRAFTPDWYLQAADGRNLLEAVPPVSEVVPPDVWTVRSDGTLTLAETVAVVELHRLELKRKRRRHPSSARLARRRRLLSGRAAPLS